MQVAKHRVVSIDYKVSGPDERELDRSPEGQPLAYVHGVGATIPGLEEALEGRDSGEDVAVTVAPDKAYGERHEELVQEVPREMFQGDTAPEPGMQFQAQTDDGARVVTVVEVQDEQVKVDANHPLAGVTLHFDVHIADVREATEDEIEARQPAG